MKQKIISGEFNYCKRTLQSWLAMGYKIVKARRWADGKYTYVLESNGESQARRWSDGKYTYVLESNGEAHCGSNGERSFATTV